MTVYRVGEGRSASGKILDKHTQWFTKLEDAVDYAVKTGKKIYVSSGNSRYQLWDPYWHPERELIKYDKNTIFLRFNSDFT